MAQIFDPLPSDQSDSILCCYVNATNQIQIARITNIPNWYFERVVFPGQRLVFETVPDAQLEIHTGMMASAILSDKIPCDRLCINAADTSSENLPISDSPQEQTKQKRPVESRIQKSRETTEFLTISVFS